MSKTIMIWIASGIIIASLIFGAVQGFLLRETVSEQSEKLRELQQEQSEELRGLQQRQSEELGRLQQGQSELAREIQDMGNKLLEAIPDTREILRDVLGSGEDISAGNPLLGWSIPEDNIVYRWRGKDEVSIVEFDREWAITAPSTISSVTERWLGNTFKREADEWVMFYTYRAYYCPIISTRIQWTSMSELASPGWAFFGLENGSASPTGLWAFQHRFENGTDRLYIQVQEQNTEITHLLPADWNSAWHYYTVVKFPNGADFWVDDVLVAVVVAAPGLAKHVEELNNVVFFSLKPDKARRNWTDYLCGFVAIEGGASPQSFQCSPYKLNLVEGNPSLSRSYEVLDIASLSSGTGTYLVDSFPIPKLVSDLTLTVSATYHSSTTQGIKVHLYTSYDGSNYDTEEQKDSSGNPIFGNMPFRAGQTVQKTKDIPSNARFIKVAIENLDSSYAVSDVKAVATLR